MEMSGNGAKTNGMKIIKKHQLTEVFGLIVRIIIFGSCGAALGTSVLTIVVQPIVTGGRRMFGAAVLVFGLSVPWTYSSITFLLFYP